MQDIIDKPIILNIHSTRYSNLTLVDLPGITKNPLEGQQSDIEKCVTDIIRPHIENENSMILAITPANHELVNSVGINLALEVNPGGGFHIKTKMLTKMIKCLFCINKQSHFRKRP